MAISLPSKPAHVTSQQEVTANPSSSTIPQHDLKQASPMYSIRLTSQALSTYPQLPQLTNMINSAFNTTALTRPDLFVFDHKRYSSPEEFVSEMGADGITFVTIQTSTGAPVATMGYKPWSRGWKLANRFTEAERAVYLIDRAEAEAKEALEPQLEKFEVVAVAVEEGWWKCGLAARLLQGIEEEVGRVLGGRFRLMVRTVKEINEGYWKGKGFVVARETMFGQGTFGVSSFSGLEMSRDHGVESNGLMLD